MYEVFDEMFFNNFMTSFQIPIPITLGIIRFWTEITQYIDFCNATLIYVKSTLMYVSKFEGILFNFKDLFLWFSVCDFAVSAFCSFWWFSVFAVFNTTYSKAYQHMVLLSEMVWYITKAQNTAKCYSKITPSYSPTTEEIV